MKRITVTIDDDDETSAVSHMLEMRDKLGNPMTIRIGDVDADTVIDTVAADTVDDVSGATIAPRRQTRQTAVRAQRQTTAIVSSVPRVGQAGARVEYRVINKRLKINGAVPDKIRLFLLANGPQTAKVIQHKLKLGQKSTESALHMLRTSGIVRSQPLQP